MNLRYNLPEINCCIDHLNLNIKYIVAEKIKQHPYSMTTIWNMLPRLNFLLPHDKSYLGFKHIAKKKNGLFLDVGANNGITAAGFHKLVPAYDIISLEANIWHEPSLIALKHRIKNFDYRIIAAGDVKGAIDLITPFYGNRAIHTHTSTSMDYLATSLRRDYSQKVFDKITYREHSIEVLPIDEMDLEPDIVKIDVEGFDYQVLLGMRNTIERCRPYLLIEFTPDHMQDFFEFFEALEYKMFVYNVKADIFEPFDRHRETEKWKSDHLQVNIYCAPQERSKNLLG